MNENLAKGLCIDFLSGPLRYRSEQAGFRNELLAKAIGVRPKENPKIIDATAGLGRDSFILASLGYEITLLERSSTIYQLLNAAILKAKPILSETINRMHLIHADAIEWLKQLPSAQKPDITYLDPMFPERKKSASVKKEMVIMQELLGKDVDHEILFATALAHTKKRVVVKRAKLAAKIGERAANFSLNGKSCRFDVYLI